MMVLEYVLPFVVVLTILVFVHEWGHYWVARRNGVRVEVFSVGFGREIFGFTDRVGTRWKFSIIPLGGYVKFHGDSNVASAPTGEAVDEAADRSSEAFHNKSVGQRAAIVVAGPLANFVFAIISFALMFMVVGHPLPPPIVGSVTQGGPAERVGILAGDEIISVDGRSVSRFAELARIVHESGGEPLSIELDRDGEPFFVTIVAEQAIGTADDPGAERFRIGVGSHQDGFGVLQSMSMAVEETVAVTWLTIATVGEMISGERGTEELGGPLRIAQISGNVAAVGMDALIWFMAVLSINLGLINLFPIPMLDGGHLLFYGIEAVRGKPLGERAQEYGFRIGLALVLTMMLLATWNDLVQLQVVAFVREIIS